VKRTAEEVCRLAKACCEICFLKLSMRAGVQVADLEDCFGLGRALVEVLSNHHEVDIVLELEPVPSVDHS
jgi:hypothetical protein